MDEVEHDEVLQQAAEVEESSATVADAGLPPRLTLNPNALPGWAIKPVASDPPPKRRTHDPDYWRRQYDAG
jgi:hypothetical protein